MKVWVPNELIFTAFFNREKSVQYIKDIFEEEYGKMDKAFTRIKPKIAYDDEVRNNDYNNAITWN